MANLAVCVFLALSAPGTVHAQFALTVPPDARSEGMGGAEVFIDPGPYAAWGNVGALGFVSGSGITGAHFRLVPDLAEDVHYAFGSAAVAVPLDGNRLVLDLSTTHIGYTFLLQSPYPNPPVTFFDDAHGFAAAIGVGARLGVGVGIKDVRSGSDPSTFYGEARTTAFDFGILYAVPLASAGARASGGSIRWEDPQVGISASNMGAPASGAPYGQVRRLPHIVRIAVGESVHFGPASEVSDRADAPASPGAERPERLRLKASVSAEKLLLHSDGPVDSTVTYTYLDRHQVMLRGGCEARLYNIIALRAGYQFDDPNEIKGWTYGAGIVFRGRAGIDFASIPQYPELSRVKKFSAWLRLPFPADRSAARQADRAPEK